MQTVAIAGIGIAAAFFMIAGSWALVGGSTIAAICCAALIWLHWDEASLSIRKRAYSRKLNIPAISLTLVLSMVAISIKIIASSPPFISNVGKIISPNESEDDMTFVNSEKDIFNEIEIGNSATIMEFIGKNGDPFIQIGKRTGLTIETIKGKLYVSTKIYDQNGYLVSEIYKNEWKVAPSPLTWDRNYSDSALEVRDSFGDIVLQVIHLGTRVRIQAIWWTSKNSGIELFSPIPAGGAEMIIQTENSPQKFINIKPMFAYPSQSHFGEIIDRSMLQ